MLQPSLYGLGVFVALELLYLPLRRARWPFRVRVAYHLWAVVLGVAATLAVNVGTETTGWKVAASLAALLTSYVLFSLLDALVFQRPWHPSRGPMMPKLARDVLRIVVLGATIMVVATAILHQPLPAVLVSSTVISAVVGLALQDVLKNVFAGVALEIEKPFERGDWLMIDGQTVQVVDTSWRSVRLRTRDGIDLWETNTLAATSRVLNYGAGQRPIAINFVVHVTYDAPPAQVKAALLRVARSAPGALQAPAPDAFVTSFAEEGIAYRLKVWTRDLPGLSRFSDGVNSRIWYELRRQGLDIPFPTRVVRWHDAEREEARAEEEHQRQSVALLSRVDLFANLDPARVSELAAAAVHQHYDDGEVLVREGEKGTSLFVVEEGRVRITKASDDSDTVVTLATVEKGGFFGEMSLLTGEPRSATVSADGGCEVLVLDGAALGPMLHHDPRLAEMLTTAVVARQADTAATLEVRRDRVREPQARMEATILGRIRAFFGLSES